MKDALLALEQIVGSQHFKAGAELDLVNKDTTPTVVRPLAYVYPGDSKDLGELVCWARHHGIALWTSGQGRNWGYGAATPLEEQSVVVILSRMNRILEVNPELAYVEIEPGVTYRQLYDFLSTNYPQVWLDVIDGSPTGSVLGNALERGVGPTPYGDHYGQLCGLEMLLPSGEIIQSGGLKGSKTWHTYRWGTGPVIDGLFSQSNLGIVLRGGLWLMPRPKAFRSLLFEMSDSASFEAFIQILQDLFFEGVIRGAVRLINEMTTLSLFIQYPNPPGECLAPDEIHELRKRYGFARWTLSAGIYGSREMVRAHSRSLKRALAPFGRVMLLSDTRVNAIERYVRHAKTRTDDGWYGRILDRLPRWLAGKPTNVLESIPHMHRLLQGQPTEYFVRHAYFKMPDRPDHDVHPGRDDCGLIWIAPIVPNTSDDIQQVLSLGRTFFEKWKFEFHAAVIFHNPRAAVVLMSIFYFKEEEEERLRATGLQQELSSEVRRQRYQEYRTGIARMDRLYTEDAVYAAFLNKIKSAIDPDNILSPGRYGLI